MFGQVHYSIVRITYYPYNDAVIDYSDFTTIVHFRLLNYLSRSFGIIQKTNSIEPKMRNRNFISFVHEMGFSLFRNIILAGVLINRMIFTELSVIRITIIIIIAPGISLARNPDDRNLKCFFFFYSFHALSTLYILLYVERITATVHFSINLSSRSFTPFFIVRPSFPFRRPRAQTSRRRKNSNCNNAGFYGPKSRQ